MLTSYYLTGFYLFLSLPLSFSLSLSFPRPLPFYIIVRKPQPTPAFSSMPSGQPVSMFPAGQAAALPGGLFQVGMNSYGQPMYVGKCKVPNCPYPQRVEGDKVHDFCSRTCAKKYSQLSMQGNYLYYCLFFLCVCAPLTYSNACM